MPAGSACRPSSRSLPTWVAAAVLLVSVAFAFEYTVCRDEDFQCFRFVDDVVYFYPHTLPSGTDSSFFDLKIQLVDIQQKNDRGFTVKPVINRWKDCGLVFEDRIQSPSPTPSQTSVPSATPTASGPNVTPSPSPSFGAPASASQSPSISDSPVASPSPTSSESHTSASNSPSPSTPMKPYQEAVVACTAVGGPQGVSMEISVKVFQAEVNVTAVTPGDATMVVPFKSAKLSYKIVWSTDPGDLSLSDSMEVQIKSSWSLPEGLLEMSNNQVNNIPTKEDAFENYVAQSGNHKGFRLDMVSRVDALFPDNALQCDSVFSCTSPDRSQANLTMETGGEQEVAFSLGSVVLGPSVEVPTEHITTFKISGVRVVTVLDPIITINPDGLLLAGSVDTFTAFIVGLAAFVGLSCICTCCCCFFCKFCPVHKMMMRKKMMNLQLAAAAKEAEHVQYTKAGGGTVDTPGPAPPSGKSNKTLSPSSIVPLTEAEGVVDGGELNDV